MISISDREFAQFSNFVRDNYGINLRKEKKTLVEARLNGVLEENGFSCFEDYLRFVVEDKTGNRLEVLINKITTNHTFFMREFEHFKYFRDVVLPYLYKSIADKDLRTWSAGCSSGEEAYTLAMVIADFFQKEKLWWNTKILATDISTRVLETAKAGVYMEEQLTSVSESWRRDYFSKLDISRYKISDSIKNEIIFRRFNLMEERFPFRRKFHVIFCRNVMIYFDTETKQKLVSKFYDMTEPGGYLFTGHSESITNLKTGYKYIMPAVYRKV